MAKTEGPHTGEFLVSEGNGTISRDTVVVTVPTGGLVAGQVLGQISASSKYTKYDDANSDGSEDAAGILFDNVPNDTNGAVDVDAVIINYAAEVRADGLTWKASVDETKGAGDLKALGVKLR